LGILAYGVDTDSDLNHSEKQQLQLQHIGIPTGGQPRGERD
jgi:hypothetical protein